jgi:hypothetical protein
LRYVSEKSTGARSPHWDGLHAIRDRSLLQDSTRVRGDIQKAANHLLGTKIEMTAESFRRYLWYSLGALVLFPVTEFLSVAPIGTWFLLNAQLIYILPAIVAVLALPVLPVAAVSRKYRASALRLLVLSAVLVASTFAGAIVGQHVRMRGMGAMADRSAALTSAIERYERDNGVAPAALEDLVPGYLAEVPSTGMMAYSRYRYLAGHAAEKQYQGNPWVLRVYTPSGGINFDTMLYFPNQNYPKQGYGGTLELVGDWAYVHE